MITKTEQQYANEIAVQIISSINGLLARLDKSLSSGIPADDNRKLPAIDPATLKAALGAEATAKLTALVTTFNE